MRTLKYFLRLVEEMAALKQVRFIRPSLKIRDINPVRDFDEKTRQDKQKNNLF